MRSSFLESRVIAVGNYVVETGATVRQAAKEFGVCKSTIHLDLTKRLPELSPRIYSIARSVLDFNKSVKHIRGGEATKLKYKGEPRGA
jgi:putative DeoR family transcriptional regulator (stage III sporulation protein D)